MNEIDQSLPAAAVSQPPCKTLTLDEWRAMGVSLFGEDIMKWLFVCPSCGHIASVQDWKDADAPESAVAFSCVGRRAESKPDAAFQRSGGPCNYAGGGLIRLNPQPIEGRSNVFAFAQGSPDGETPQAKGDY